MLLNFSSLFKTANARQIYSYIEWLYSIFPPIKIPARYFPSRFDFPLGKFPPIKFSLRESAPVGFFGGNLNRREFELVEKSIEFTFQW